MGILSLLKRKKKDEEVNTEPVPPTPKPNPRKPTKSGGSKTGLVALVCLLVGVGGGFVGGSFEPNIIRPILSQEPLVPQSDLLQLRTEITKLKTEINKKPNQVAKKEEPRRNRRIPEQETQSPFTQVQRQERQERPAQPFPKPESEYIDEIGTRNTNQDIVRTRDLPTRTVVPRGVRNDVQSLDFTQIRLTPEKIQQISSFRENGVHFFLSMNCDYCKEGYALASNLHERYPEMPTEISFIIKNNDEILIYATWLAIRLIDEESAWNFLNFAFNNKNFPNSNAVLIDYESFNPKFNRNNLISFWSNHKETISNLLDMPNNLINRYNFDQYKIPFVAVHGQVNSKYRDLDSIREAYLKKIQSENQMPRSLQ